MKYIMGSAVRIPLAREVYMFLKRSGLFGVAVFASLCLSGFGGSATASAAGTTPQTITFPTITASQYALTSLPLVATATSGLPVSFTSTTLTICTVSGTTASLLTPGTCILHAAQAGNSNYSAAPAVSQGFYVHPAQQTITFKTITGAWYALQQITLSATASSGLAVSFSTTTPTVCSVSGNTASLLIGGSCILQATQAGNALYGAALPVTQVVAVHLAHQSITVTPVTGTKYALSQLALSASSNSGLAVTLTSVTPAVCTLSGNTASFLTAGTCDIHANQAGNATYAVAPLIAYDIDVHPIIQTITFTPVPSPEYPLTKVTLSATATSGLTVSFFSITPTICTVSGKTASLLTAGNCYLHAVQTGNPDYAAAPIITQQVVVTPLSQTTTWPAITATQYAASQLPLSATASSGLTVAFASTTPTICTVSGATASLLTSGTCILQARQAGNSIYAAASLVQQSVVVHSAAQTITFPAITSQLAGAHVTLSATASSGLTVAFSSTTTSVCTVSGTTATMLTSGTCTIHATQTGNTTYAAAPLVSQSFTVNSVPQPTLTPSCPSGSTCPLGPGVVNNSYEGSIGASGGSGSGYNFTVVVNSVVTAVPNNNSDLMVADGIWVSSIGSNLLTIGGYPGSTPQTVSLVVTVTDSNNQQASGSYTIAIGSAPVGFTVTGNVHYSGSQSGWTYINLGTYGTAISASALASGGAFTIRGVPPGNYQVQAWMDTLGYGAENASDPSTHPLPAVNINVPNAPLSGVSVPLADPSTSTPSSAPTLDNLQGYGTFSGGVFISYDPILNSNGVELPTSYTLEWSTDSTFETGVSSKSFAATSGYRSNNTPLTGGRNPWVVTGLTNGQTYYFRAAGVVGSAVAAVTGPWSSPSGPMTVGAPSSGNAVSGTVTIPSTITPTGPLYVGFWDQNAGNIYATTIAAPSSSTANAYSVKVPTGSNYFFFAFLDQNNSGLISGPGQLSNTNGYNMGTPSLAITGAKTGVNLTLPSANSSTVILTGNDDGAGYSGTSSTESYEIDLMVSSANKIPVAVTLLANSNVAFTQDIAEHLSNGYNPKDRFWLYIEQNSPTPPTVGAAYSVQVTYSDGSSETLSPTVTAVLPRVTALDLSPLGPNSSNPTPTFTWQYPTSPGNYVYQLWLADEKNYSTIWSIPTLLSSSNAFTSSVVTSILWGTDPTDPSNPPTIPNLVSGETYWWQIVAYDANGNRSQAGGSYSPGYTPLALPAPNPSSLPPATLYQPYSGSITATGGYAGYDGHIYSINDTNHFWWSGAISLGDGLYVPFTASPSGSLEILGTPYATGQVSFQVYVEDGAGTVVGPVTYTINVAEAPITLPASGTVSALVGYPYSHSLYASGGSGTGYAFSVGVNGGAATAVPASPSALPLADGLSATSIGSQLIVSGTPSTAATIILSVYVNDSQSNSTSQTYTIDAVNPPNGANNQYLNGNYVCKFDGFFDRDGSRWTSLSSIKANGSAGTITNGVWDMNGRDLTAEMGGTVTGAYSIGPDNNGLMTMNSIQTVGGSGTHSGQYAIALNNTGSATTATEFRMVEIDDIGSNPSGQTGTGDCYLANTSAFAASTLSGNSFVYLMTGEDYNGTPAANVGRYSAGTESATGGTGGAAGGSISSGYYDSDKVSSASGDQPNSFTGTYLAPDTATGRFTATINQTFSGQAYTGHYVEYIIDAARMFLLGTDPIISGGNSAFQSGDVRAQQQSSYSAANLNGPFVLYAQGYEYSDNSVSGYDSSVFQGSGSGAGTMTINQSYADSDGDYSAGKENGQSENVSFDTVNSGRATFSPGSDQVYMYFFNNNSALYLDVSDSYMETGWIEAQTETTFNYAAVAGTYLLGQLPRTEPYSSGNVGEIATSSCSSGSSSCGWTGGVTTAGSGSFSFDQSTGSMTYNWDASAPGTGSYLVETGGKGLSCVVISATRDACIVNADTPSVMILQQ